MKTIKELRVEAKNKGLTIEFYTSSGSQMSDSLHTNSIEFMFNPTDQMYKVEDYTELSAEDYNNTIEANTSESTDDELTMVVVIVEK